MTGRLIVLEGLDGVGKSTIAAALAARLDAVLLSTPDVSIASERQAMDALYAESADAAHLFYASYVAHVSRLATQNTNSGLDVIVDRYWLSTRAYDVIRGSGLGLRELERRLRPADFTFLLTASIDVRRRRLAARPTTANDAKSLDPEVARRIDHRFRRGLKRRVAGTGIIVNLTDRSVDAGVAVILAHLRQS